MEIVATPAPAPKHLTIWDIKYLTKGKSQAAPDKEMVNLEELYAKDPSDITREATIQEVILMMMKLQETMHKEMQNQEIRYQALLKAKDVKI